jgi:hypothetical protein
VKGIAALMFEYPPGWIAHAGSVGYKEYQQALQRQAHVTNQPR